MQTDLLSESEQRLDQVDAILRTLLDLRARDASHELIDLELQILKIRARLTRAPEPAAG